MQRQPREDILEQTPAGCESSLCELAGKLGRGGQQVYAARRLHGTADEIALGLEALPRRGIL